MKRVFVETTEPGSLRHSLEISGYEPVYSDVDTAAGGSNSAPDPHDYFDMALGACKAQTVMLYARRKGMALDKVRVLVLPDGSQEREGRYQLNVVLELEGDLSEEEQARLLAISQRCPIEKLMTKVEISIDTSLGQVGED